MKKFFFIVIASVFALSLSFINISYATDEITPTKKLAQLKKEKRGIFVDMIVTAKKECRAEIPSDQDAQRECFRSKVKNGVKGFVRAHREAKKECKEFSDTQKKICAYEKLVTFASSHDIAVDEYISIPPISPEEQKQYNEIIENMTDAFITEAESYIPEIKEYTKIRENISLDLSMNDNMRENSESFQMNLDMESLADFTGNTPAINISGDLLMDAKLHGMEMGSIDVSGAAIAKDDQIFFQLTKADLQIPLEPSSNTVVTPLLYTWFGGDINGMDIPAEARKLLQKTIFENTRNPAEIQEAFSRILRNTKAIQVTKVLPEEKGNYRFEGRIQIEEIANILVKIFEELGMPEYEINSLKREIEREAKNTKIYGVFSVDKNSPQNFSFEGNIETKYENINLSFENSKYKTSLKIWDENGKFDAKLYKKEKNQFEWNVKLHINDKEEASFLGEKTNSTFTFDFTIHDSNDLSFSGDFSKTGKYWNGTTEGEIDGNIALITLEKFLLDEHYENLEAKGNVELKQVYYDGREEIITIEFDLAISITEDGSIQIIAPKEYKTFEELEQIVEEAEENNSKI